MIHTIICQKKGFQLHPGPDKKAKIKILFFRKNDINYNTSYNLIKLSKTKTETPPFSLSNPHQKLNNAEQKARTHPSPPPPPPSCK
jgi:hypothetical protein